MLLVIHGEKDEDPVVKNSIFRSAKVRFVIF